jgi:hypothetical protein
MYVSKIRGDFGRTVRHGQGCKESSTAVRLLAFQQESLHLRTNFEPVLFGGGQLRPIARTACKEDHNQRQRDSTYSEP